MSRPTYADAAYRPPWHAPGCPECGALDIYVSAANTDADWQCHKCGEAFDAEVQP